jgi:hypothetical protein
MPLEWGKFWLQVAEHPNDMQGHTCLADRQWNYSKELFPEAKSKGYIYLFTFA